MKANRFECRVERYIAREKAMIRWIFTVARRINGTIAINATIHRIAASRIRSPTVFLIIEGLFRRW